MKLETQRLAWAVLFGFQFGFLFGLMTGAWLMR
jgi:hypothetical protein